MAYTKKTNYFAWFALLAGVAAAVWFFLIRKKKTADDTAAIKTATSPIGLTPSSTGVSISSATGSPVISVPLPNGNTLNLDQYGNPVRSTSAVPRGSVLTETFVLPPRVSSSAN
jgi:hypothetical protein